MNFVKGLLTNRFGIILATLNVCYFLTKIFSQHLFEHSHGEHCVFLKTPVLMPWIDFGIVNIPAGIFSILSIEAMSSIFSSFCAFTQAKVELAVISIFITLQWLFIAHLARVIAQKLSKSSL